MTYGIIAMEKAPSPPPPPPRSSRLEKSRGIKPASYSYRWKASKQSRLGSWCCGARAEEKQSLFFFGLSLSFRRALIGSADRERGREGRGEARRLFCKHAWRNVWKKCKLPLRREKAEAEKSCFPSLFPGAINGRLSLTGQVCHVSRYPPPLPFNIFLHT